MSRRLNQQINFFLRPRELLRITGLLLMLAVIWMLMVRARDPAMWKWISMAEADKAQDDYQATKPDPNWKATVHEGPNDASEDERQRIDREIGAITDREPLVPVEMAAYWRMVKWARNSSFNDLNKRAHKGVMFTKFWDEPTKYRAQPIRLRLHLKRVLFHDAPANNVGVKRVYEAWGPTDESKSYPYVIVFEELPPGMATGSDVREDVIFVGYFLKVMSYEAFDRRRFAPMLIGRIEWRPSPTQIAEQEKIGAIDWPTIIGGILLLLIVARLVVSMMNWGQPGLSQKAAEAYRASSSPEDLAWLTGGEPLPPSRDSGRATPTSRVSDDDDGPIDLPNFVVNENRALSQQADAPAPVVKNNPPEG